MYKNYKRIGIAFNIALCAASLLMFMKPGTAYWACVLGAQVGHTWYWYDLYKSVK